MDWELPYHELLICLHHYWFDLFQSLDPTGKSYLSTEEVILTSEAFKYPLTETLRSCKYLLSSAIFMLHGVEVAFILIL